MLQWLDELEDLILAFAFACHNLCRFCLALGLVASLLVIVPGVASFPSLLALTAIAVASVLAWSVAVVAAFVGADRFLASA